MKKLAIFTSLLIISCMNITMRPSSDTPKMSYTENFSDGGIHEVSQPDCTDNTSPVAGVWNGTIKIEYTNQ
ncbi:MAG TPA: hypothetical protein PLR52_05905, partial [Bacteroidales bacterium]|nr:hypothetical protein [Bacteroidales bacterium]